MTVWAKMWIKLVKSGSKTLDDVPQEYYDDVEAGLDEGEGKE